MTETTITIPDLVGETGRAEIVAAAIRDLQVQREQVSISALINDSDDADTFPGTNMTYAARFAQIDSAIERLADHSPEAMKLIVESQGA